MSKIKNHFSMFRIPHSTYQEKSFTLIETLIVVAILSALVGTAFVEFSSYKARHSFDLDSESVVDALRNAQTKAIQQENGQAWGVRFTSGTQNTYAIFYGTSYSASSVVTQETLNSVSSFTNPPSGYSIDVVFSKLTGTPTTGASFVIVIKRNGGNDIYSVFVSKSGKISKNLETGLVGYWPMDEGSGTIANDASGSGNNATLYGSSTWAAGRSGSALSLTTGASPNNALTATARNINNPTGLTLTTWVYPTSYSAEEMTVINGQSPASYYLSVYLDGSINCYWYGTSPAGYHSSGASTVPLNQWTQITCAWNGSIINLYTNGQLKNTIGVTGNGTIATVVNMGAESTGRQFRGSIDDARIYNRALSATEVQNLYNSY